MVYDKWKKMLPYSVSHSDLGVAGVILAQFLQENQVKGELAVHAMSLLMTSCDSIA